MADNKRTKEQDWEVGNVLDQRPRVSQQVGRRCFFKITAFEMGRRAVMARKNKWTFQK